MALYRYVKSKQKSITGKQRWARFLPALFLIGGLVFLANATLPILLYRWQSKSKTQVLGEGQLINYAKPSAWFPNAPQLPSRPSKITHYALSIPKLKIEDAVVEVGGEDIMKSLVQYSGTALPGQYGNAVIFGHSALPQFFNPRNYKTIFTRLTALEEGDEILINFDGILYRYQVTEMIEVMPTDISVLAQYYDHQNLTLVTCVPPGYYSKRWVVRARLI